MQKPSTTAQGDTWDQIAHDAMGSERYAPELMRTNWRHITTAVFPGGVTLTIPERDTPATETVAPWRRNTV